MSSEARNWTEANTSCAEMGMSLALRNILNDSSIVLNNPRDQFWIGLRRDDDQSDFIWSDGVTLTDFLRNYGGDCGNIHYEHLHGEMCSRVLYYICQRMKGTGKNI